MPFKLEAPYQPTGDQPRAIKKLSSNLSKGVSDQVLLGVTGSGKTFTVANVIAEHKKPTLVISHNKTLAAQLYQEFKEFFPNNAVEYFVSYYDYYQPESYLPATDTYIEKDSAINEEIDRLRLKATTSLMTREDVIIVASVSCIYALGSPEEYQKAVLELRLDRRGEVLSPVDSGAGGLGDPAPTERSNILRRLIDIYYERNDFELKRGTFRVNGDIIDIWPAYENFVIRLEFLGESLANIKELHPLTFATQKELSEFILYPAKHYVADPATFKQALTKIEADMAIRVKELMENGHKLEAYRLEQRTKYDLEMLREIGFVKGIENYSRYFDGRGKGTPPFTLLDFFAKRFGGQDKKDWLLVVDESHISIPQIRGMYNGDQSRKQTLVDFGFRLPSALDNRPLNFDEFLERQPQTIYMSATPSEWEMEQAVKSSKLVNNAPTIVEQLIRPTGLIDPKITVLPSNNQIQDLRRQIENKVKLGQRVLVTTLTKRMAEELADFLANSGLKVTYLHSDVETLERTNILDDLRRGNYDVLVGINLLREGLDLPEVSLVAILDADKEGFLRSETSLIQVMGRAARHIQGEVIMYADKVTGSMQRAIAEVDRRRAIQVDYNKTHGITPTGITKSIRERMVEEEVVDDSSSKRNRKQLLDDLAGLPPTEVKRKIKELEKEMKLAAEELNFELAAQLRDEIVDIKKNL